MRYVLLLSLSTGGTREVESPAQMDHVEESPEANPSAPPDFYREKFQTYSKLVRLVR